VHNGTLAQPRLYAPEMSDAANVTFSDPSDGDEVRVGVRSVEGGTSLALSKKSDGDLEVVLPDAVAHLVAALGSVSPD
jgi:hypothetical protein